MVALVRLVPMRQLIMAKALVLGVLLALLHAAFAAPDFAANAVPGRWVWPMEPVPPVVRFFEPPAAPYGPGHRGVDLLGSLGQPVLAIGGGTVTFAGSVAGRGVVVVDHGGLRSTYQPVAALVPAGTTVRAGQPIGSLELVHSHCLPAACLHLGVKRGEVYLDPLPLLGPRPVRLKPIAGLGGEARRAPQAPPASSLPARPMARSGGVAEHLASVAALVTASGAAGGLAAGWANRWPRQG
ncbi:MAG: hypothetical protein QOI06_1892 [Nocardioidaceae bacterium]|jgi:hypothetical protein|nr:hypothetical protein [Nocardioidaceae bacterium]